MARLSSFGEYRQQCGETSLELLDQGNERDARMERFPYAVVLELAYPELDFANRWLWQSMGPACGECIDKYSEYRSCLIDFPHSHPGTWASEWLEKIDYNHGFNEWYFAEQSAQELFLQFVPSVSWGEKYPKS